MANATPNASNLDAAAVADASPMLSVDHLVVEFKTSHGMVHAVSDISFTVKAGETLSVVGESGSGKSTVAKAIMGLLHQARVRSVFEGAERSRAQCEASCASCVPTCR